MNILEDSIRKKKRKKERKKAQLNSTIINIKDNYHIYLVTKDLVKKIKNTPTKGRLNLIKPRLMAKNKVLRIHYIGFLTSEHKFDLKFQIKPFSNTHYNNTDLLFLNT